VPHRFAVAVENAAGDGAGARHHYSDVLDLLIVGDGYRDSTPFENTLSIFRWRKCAAGLCGSDTPASRTHLFERKPAVLPGRRRHAFTTGSATFRLPHFHGGSGNGIARPENCHNPLDCGCAWRQRLLRRLLHDPIDHEGDGVISGSDNDKTGNIIRRPWRFRGSASPLKENHCREREKII
jgi:hypothetical protein